MPRRGPPVRRPVRATHAHHDATPRRSSRRRRAPSAVLARRGLVDDRFVHIWTLADGKVSKYEQLADTRKFCDAVGK
jgi:hypothetical protein